MVWELEKDREYAAIQANFFDIIEKPEFVIKGTPTRTVSCFWREDILPTAHLIRDVYIGGGIGDNEKEMLDFTWNWVRQDVSKMRNFEMPNSRHRIGLEELKAIPIEVLLNRATAYFFAMEEDYKVPLSRKIFEAFVAFKPGTSDWENDVRRVTFDIVHKLRTRPMELGTRITKAMKQARSSYSDDVLIRLGLDEQMLDRLETIDGVTWGLLSYYHQTLLRREKALIRLLQLE